MPTRKLKPLILSDYIDPRTPISRVTSGDVITVREASKMGDVIDLFLHKSFERNSRKLFVVDNKNRLKGLISPTDMLSFLGAGPKFEEYKKSRMDTYVTRVMERPAYVSKQITLEKILPMFRNGWYGTYPIVQEDEFRGVISQWDLIKNIKKKTGLDVNSIMVRKPLRVREEFSVFDTVKMMVRGPFNTLPVTHKGILSGFVMPHDVLSYLGRTKNLDKLHGLDAKTSQVMKRNILTVRPSDDVSVAISVMSKTRMSSLPVTYSDEVVGIISEKDIIDSMY